MLLSEEEEQEVEVEAARVSDDDDVDDATETLLPPSRWFELF